MSSRRRRRHALPRIVKHLGLVSFLNDLASEMVYPLLPALVTTRLGGTAVALGVLDGIAEAVAAFLKLGSGWLGERLRWRGPLVVGGYAVAAIARPIMGVVGAAWQVIALRAADRMGKGVRTPPRDAVIADASAAELRGRAFGFHRAMDHAGAVVGPLVAWTLIAGAGTSPAQAILWSLVPGLLAVVVVGWAMTRRGVRSHKEWGGERPSPADAPRASEHPAGSRVLFGLVVAFAFARFPETLFLLRLQDLGVTLALIPVVWALMHVVRASTSYTGGWLSDRLGPRHTMLAGWIVYAAVCLGLAGSSSAPWAVAWFLVFGLVAAVTESPERVFVAGFGRAATRGRRFGLYHASVGAAALPGGLMLGALYAHVSAPTALAVSGGAVLALSVVGFLCRPPSPTTTD